MTGWMRNVFNVPGMIPAAVITGNVLLTSSIYLNFLKKLGLFFLGTPLSPK
jgi:hypothetical protein